MGRIGRHGKGPEWTGKLGRGAQRIGLAGTDGTGAQGRGRLEDWRGRSGWDRSAMGLIGKDRMGLAGMDRTGWHQKGRDCGGQDGYGVGVDWQDRNGSVGSGGDVIGVDWQDCNGRAGKEE